MDTYKGGLSMLVAAQNTTLQQFEQIKEVEQVESPRNGCTYTHCTVRFK